MYVTVTIEIPDTGEDAPEVMPSQEDVRRCLDQLFREEDAIPWYGEVSMA